MLRRRDGVNATCNWSWCHGTSFHVRTDATTLVLGLINTGTNAEAHSTQQLCRSSIVHSALNCLKTVYDSKMS